MDKPTCRHPRCDHNMKDNCTFLPPTLVMIDGYESPVTYVPECIPDYGCSKHHAFPAWQEWKRQENYPRKIWDDNSDDVEPAV